MLIFVALILVFAAVACGVVLLARLARDELAALRADSATQLAARTADVDRRLAGFAETVDRRLGQLDVKVDRRLETAQQTSAAIHERLGKVDSAATQMLERAGDLARLEQALRPP